jgi:N-acetylmuramic acid 6-phosphate etherase
MSSPAKSNSQAPETAAEFLAIASQFHLGGLPTEARHEKTCTLSTLAKTDLAEGIRVAHSVEREALAHALRGKDDSLAALGKAVRETWLGGGKIFFVGCGATGRLSVSIEALWRKEMLARGHAEDADRVRSFIAGGDYALVRSIENFEDHPEFGARQLRDLGFTSRDLLIATTEGGETPFVIGATLEAATISKAAPWFLFCNPVETLLGLERCRSIFEHTHVRSLSLPTGPMAVCGSTRLQASTVLMLVAGAALFSAHDGGDLMSRIHEFQEALASADFTGLVPLIERESEAYRKGSRCVHVADEHAITVLTDTTERSPTFSLVPFENAIFENEKHAWTYLSVPSAESADQAWEKILMRPPRPLSWKGYERYGAKTLTGFDFSAKAIERRKKEIGPALIYSVEKVPGFLQLSIGGRVALLESRGSRLTEHLILKCAMNISSTLVMGRLGRFESNLMLYVKASNNKLIDRAIRFITLLLNDEAVLSPNGRPYSYEEICEALFVVRPKLGPEEPVVLRTLEYLKSFSMPSARRA